MFIDMTYPRVSASREALSAVSPAIEERHSVQLRFPAYKTQLIQQTAEEPVDILLIPDTKKGMPEFEVDPAVPQDYQLESLFELYRQLSGKHILQQSEMLANWLSLATHPDYVTAAGLSLSGDTVVDLVKEIQQNPDRFAVSVSAFVGKLELLYKKTMLAYIALSLAEGKIDRAEQIRLEMTKVTDCPIEGPVTADDAPTVFEMVLDGMPAVAMSVTSDDRQFFYTSFPDSIFDAAFSNLLQLITFGNVATPEWQQKNGADICENCGRVFLKKAPRQRYCSRKECQNVRIKIKSRTYYQKQRGLSDEE